MGGCGAGDAGVCGGDQVARLQVLEHGAAGGQRDGMGVVGEAVEERAGTGGDGVDDFLAGDDCAEWGVSAGEPFGGYEDVGGEKGIFSRRIFLVPVTPSLSQPVLDREVPAGAAH